MLLFVSGEYPPEVGGVGDYTAMLRHALAARGRPSRVLSRTQLRRWDARSLVWLLRAAPRRGLVHIQFQAGAFDLLGDVCIMPALLKRARPHVQVLTTFHDARVPYLFPGARWLRPKSVQLLARTSQVVIAADASDLRALGGPSPRHFQVPIGPNVPCSPPAGYERSAFRASLGLLPDTLAVVYFGLLNASKGLDLLIDAFERVTQAQPDARLLLLGASAGASDPTDRATAAALAARLEKLAGRVLRTGWLEPAQLSAHLLAADVAVLPYVDGASARRGSLLTCAEHGLPIVSTQPAAPEVANAVLAVPRSAESVAEAVLHVSTRSDLAATLRSASRTLAQATSWASIADQHIQIYDQLLDSLP